MDVLIKNMTLPTEDEQINLTILSDGSVIEHFKNESGKWSSYRSGGVKAIELPPHGDLKDSWVLFSLFERELGSSVIGQRVKNLIVNSPTILEASNE